MMANTVNYPLRTTPEIKAAAEALTELAGIEDLYPLRSEVMVLSIFPMRSMNAAFNGLTLLGMRRTMETLTGQIAAKRKVLATAEGYVRYLLDHPDEEAVRASCYDGWENTEPSDTVGITREYAANLLSETQTEINKLKRITTSLTTAISRGLARSTGDAEEVPACGAVTGRTW
jgi:hypothetical protein